MQDEQDAAKAEKSEPGRESIHEFLELRASRIEALQEVFDSLSEEERRRLFESLDDEPDGLPPEA